ncbi:hypothetical protein HDF18_22515 [Mucilaginibacter sp. X5P1]|uniref:hypothetical protein n=1 Tax=Mucilaginibacter sp. X5P1 TaxID=2723088 RepID=UPI00161D3B5C|nr:hypothetical protein [Mucilaginibacter sp. X5P1]MBB6141054.1 hypothetical protein [Mucilaginibacter sp. X5P1]
MKYILLLCLLIAGPRTITNVNQQQNALTIYLGKYQMTVRGQTGYIQISIKDGELLQTALWSGEQHALKHLTGDNFIMQGKDWSVKFMRDKKGTVVSVLVMGSDLWTKVNN